MKIAFVGKGGSGKSTTTTFFIRYLLEKGKTVLTVDADINMHVADLLDITREKSVALSEPANVQKIRSYLRGTNPRIKEVGHFVKTTPPGAGSALIRLEKGDEIMQTFARSFADTGYYMFVGTYDTDEIGAACYHTNLSIFENILSHTVLKKDEWLVADMVAGTDAFSNTLHAQFDAIVLVIEPTPEGISVYKQYIDLATAAGVAENIYVVGNKIEGETDIVYLQEHVGERFLGGFSLKKEIKFARQQGTPLTFRMLADTEVILFDEICKTVEQKGVDTKKKLQNLHKLHTRYVQQDYIVNACGDITNQIDQAFQYPQE